MLYTEQQWQAMCSLRMLGTKGRQSTASTKALKSMLVDGLGEQEAADLHGCTRQAVNLTLNKTRATIEMARIAAGAPDL